MKTGDTVKHGPTGETWTVAYVEGDRLAWLGRLREVGLLPPLPPTPQELLLQALRERDEATNCLRRLLFLMLASQHTVKDHACRLCVPGGLIVIPDFLCARHEAPLLLARLERDSSQGACGPERDPQRVEAQHAPVNAAQRQMLLDAARKALDYLDTKVKPHLADEHILHALLSNAIRDTEGAP